MPGLDRNFLRVRQREAEWMDAADADPAELAKSLRFLRRINRLLGYANQTVAHIEKFSRNWKSGQRISIIDFATGSGDVPRAILRWADRRGFDISVVAVDFHATTARVAAAQDPHPRLKIVQADVLDLPFADDSFDYAITSMFLHHLSEDEVAKVLTNMGRVARRGIVAADLLRNRRAYNWISLFTLFARPMVRHDARVSVAQAFTEDEILALRDRAGLTFAALHHHFAHRFILAGEKTLAAEPVSARIKSSSSRL